MRILVTRDDGTTEAFENVTDAYLAVRQSTPWTDGNHMTFRDEMRSYTWGNNVRELAKELAQSVLELQDFLRRLQRGGTS